MNRIPRRCLLLALGNDFLKEEGVGLVAARLLKTEFQDAIDIVEAPGAGLALLDLLTGYDQVLFLDAIFTGYVPTGTVLEFCRDDLQNAATPSAHHVALPEVLRQAERLGLEFPQELRILILEVENPLEWQAGTSPSARKALVDYVDRARQVLQGWII